LLIYILTPIPISATALIFAVRIIECSTVVPELGSKYDLVEMSTLMWRVPVSAKEASHSAIPQRLSSHPEIKAVTG
jgi:hypothetical protein